MSIRAITTAATDTFSPNVDNVQEISIWNQESDATDTMIFDLAATSDVQRLVSSKSVDGSETTFDNIADASIQLELNNAEGQYTPVFTASALNGSTDISINVSDGTDAEVQFDEDAAGTADTRDEVETVSLNSTGSDANTLALDVGDPGNVLETINFSGDQDLTLTSNVDFNEVTTVDAEGASGGLDIDLDSNAQDVTFNGGSGNDRVDFDDALTQNDSVDMGSGDANTVAITTATLTDTALDNASNVQRLEFTDAGSTADLSLAEDEGITTFVWSGGGNIDPDNNKDGFSHIINADATQFTPEPSTDDLTNVLNVELVNADVDQLSDDTGAGAIETVNLTSSADTDGSLDNDQNLIDTNIDLPTGAELNLDGEANLKVNSVLNSIVLKGASFNGDLDLTASTNADDITSGSGDDVIDSLGGADSIDISAGGDDTIDVSVVRTNNMTITGFSDGDTLDIDEDDGDAGENEITSQQGTAVDATTDTTQIITFDASNKSMLSAGTETVADFTDTTDVAAYLDEGYTGVADEDFYVILNDGTDSYIYDFAEDDSGDNIDADEVTLIGTVDNFVMEAADVTQS